MSAISTILTRLRAAIWAIDVRDDIANAIEQCYSDVSNPTLKTEALEAALQTKIDAGEMAALTIGDHTITAAKLAQGVIDNTLVTSGAAADAKKTGDEISAIKADLGSFKTAGGADKYFSNVKVYGSPVNIGISNIRNNYGSADAKQTGFAIFPANTDTEWGSALKNVTNAAVSGHFKETLGDGRTYEFDYDLSGLASGTRDTVRDAAHVIKKTRFYDVPVTPPLSDAAKEALINCLWNVVWNEGTGAEYIQTFTTALYNGNPPVDTRLIYELINTDISNSGIDTGIPVFPLGSNFTILAKATINQIPSSKTSGILLNHGSLSTGTLRLGFDNSEGTLKFITVMMHVTQYGSVQPSSNVSHNAIWMVRMTGTTAKKVLYVDGVKACDEEENISSYASGKTFTGNYFISKITASDVNNYFPGTVNMLRIYNAALSASEIESIMGVDF